MAKKTKQEKKNAKYWKDRAIRMEEEKEAAAEALAERTRQSYIRSFKRLNRDIDALYVEILDKGIENMMATDLYNLQRYVALREKIAKEIEGLAVQDNERLSKLLDDIAVGTYESNCKEMGIDFTILSEQQAKAIASENWTGVRFSDRIWGNANDFNARVMTDIEELILGGKGPDKLKKKLIEDYSVKFHEADRLIRTEASHAYNSAALQSYVDAGLQEIDFLAESDCCELCEPYRKKRFPIDDVPVIPVHPNCRCTYLPVVPGFTS
jgi:SPP1 gp7 family putative phage head morphogenesis protein